MKKKITLFLFVLCSFYNIYAQDLVVDSVVYNNDELVLGDGISFNFYYSNIDSTDCSTYSYIYLYLSKDNTYDYLDYLITNTYFSAVPGNTQVSSSPSYNPSNLEPGNYYIIARGDGNNRITETNEDNNVLIQPLKVVEKQGAGTVDIIASEITADKDTFEITEQISGSFSSANITNDTVTQFYTRLFLSKDTIQDGNDYYMGNYYYGDTLFLNDTADFNFNYNLSGDILPGDYYLLTFADYYNYYDEANEQNNYLYKKIVLTLSNDIYADNLVVQASASVGSRFTYSFDLHKTLAEIDLNSVRTKAYLSTDNILDVNDDLVIDENYISINPSETTRSLSFSNSLSNTGSYYLIISVDSENQKPETNETNNIITSAMFNVTPSVTDLMIDSAKLTSDTVDVSSSVSFSAYISNSGSDTLTYVYIATFISTDSVLDPTDIYSNDYSFYLNETTQKYNMSSSTYIQPYVAEGDYYILFAVDYSSYGETRITETNENNNVFGVPVYINNPSSQNIDLNLKSLTLNTTEYSRNVSSYFNYVYNNIGSDETPTYSYAALFLSSDSAYDYSDIRIDRDYLGTNISSSDVSRNFNFTISNVDTGDYYFVAVLNHVGTFTETDYTNNVLISEKIKVIQQDYDFEALSFTPPSDTIIIDQNNTYNLTFRNNASDLPSNTNLYYRIYLSDDPVYDYFDKYLSGSSASNVMNGDIVTHNRGFQINDVTEGDYYLLFRVDYNNNFNETDETNNMLAIPIYVKHVNIDYQIASVNLASELIAGTSNPIEIKIINNGTDVASGHVVYLLLSETSEYSEVWSKHLNSISIGTIAPKDTATINVNLSPSKELEPKNYYLQTYVDRYNNASETDEENNLDVKMVSIVESVIDIVVNSTVLANDTLDFNENNNVQVTLLNQGNTYVSYIYFAAYISLDATLDAGDNRIYTSNVSFTQGDDTSSVRSFSYSLNSSEYAPRDYYLIIEADYNENVDETNETNNTYAIPFTLKAPDYDLKLISAEFNNVDTITTNSYEYFNFTVANLGNDALPSYFRVGYYISEDAMYDDDDYLISSYYFGTFEANDTLNRSTSLQLADVPEGDYYIIFYADYQERHYEIDRENNFYAIPVYIKNDNVDLTVSDVWMTSSADIKQGTYFNIRFKINNTGTTMSRSFRTKLYISRDSVLDVTDKEIYDQYTSSLQGMSEISYSRSVTCATDTIGEHFVLAEIDYQEVVEETDETNNVRGLKINVISSDMELNSTLLTLQEDTINQNSYLYFSSTTQNTGADRTGLFQDGLYMSTDTIFDAFDVLVYSRNLSNINGGASYTYNSSIYFNSSIYYPGDYYLIKVVDHQKVIFETNENNNISYIKFTISGTANIPDISFNSLTVTDSIFYLSDNLPYSLELATDEPITRYTYLGVYLSEDSLLDDNDYRFYTRYISAFTTTYSTSSNFNFTLGDYESGDYYFLFVADAYKYIFESSEANNVVAIPVQLIKPDVDLITSDITAVSSISAGSDLPVSITVMNTGDSTDLSFNCNLVLSKDTIPDVIDKSISYFGAYIDDATGQSTYNFTKALPNMDAGTYYIVNDVDANNNIFESNENNNVNYQPITITENKKDIGIENFAIDKDQNRPGDTTHVSFDISAINTEKITKGFYTEIFLSEDETLDFFDQLIDNIYLDSVVPGSPYHHEFEYVMALKTGKYYIIVDADYSNLVTERDEENNTEWISFLVKYPKTLDVKSIEEKEFDLYPNPANNFIHLEFNEILNDKTTLYIYDVSGKAVLIKEFYNIVNNTINVSGLQKGLYFVRILSGERVFVNKFIVN